MAFYDVNSAIQKPNMLAMVQQGMAFGTQQRQLREEEKDRMTLRDLTQGAIGGDFAKQDQIAAIDPQRGAQVQDLASRRGQQMRGFIDYVEQARKTGNPAAVNAALRAGAPFLSSISGKPAPTEWTPELEADWEQFKAMAAMQSQSAQAQEPAGFRQAHLTAIASGYQPGTPEYQRAMQVAAGTAPRAIPAGYTPRTYRDVNGQEVMELVQNRGEGAGQVIMPGGGQQAPQQAPASPAPVAPEAVQADMMVLSRMFGVQPSSLQRDPAKNAAVGGVANSQHIAGTAGDFPVSPEQKPQFMAVARQLGYEAIDEGDHIHLELPPQRGGGGGPGRGQTDDDRANAAADQAARVEAARIAAQQAAAPRQAELDAEREAGITSARSGATNQAEREAVQRTNNTAFAQYTAARDTLLTDLAATSTGPVVGRLPAVTEAQQIAQGAQARMAPILKGLFRTAGEGTFTDKDQELLMAMVPTRADLPGAVTAKMAGIDAIIKAKLQQGGEQQQDAPASDDEALFRKYIQ